MNSNQIRAFIPQAAYLEGKQEQIYPQFHEDFALLDPRQGYAAVAARGLFLKLGQAPAISPDEIAFLEENLSRRDMVAIDSESGILLALGHLYGDCGLIPVILPHHAKAATAYALECLTDPTVLLSPASAAHASRCDEAEDAYAHCAEMLGLCEQLLRPSETLDFRLLCARAAQVAGCRANVTQLPVGAYPIRQKDQACWTAFLLCVFLALRGDSAAGSELSLDHADRREFHLKLSHRSEYARKIPVSETVHQFLELPAFSDFRLIPSKGCFAIEARLRRKSSDAMLRAHAPLASSEILRLELWSDATPS